MNLPPGGSEGMIPFMHRASDELKENIRNINETKPKQKNYPTN